ncbi:MAG: D-alanyl-D-alanine carboxypeptidase [Defluviitaleaceae bacterium]|nr:D-alanyl-D-alanine carboxypeptidase [Defluviitaleaceae bacterium]
MKKVIFYLTFFIFNSFFVKDIFAEQHLDITGTAVILMERSTGRVVYERNADTPIYPASMIKVLTAIVLLDHTDINDIVRVGNSIYHVPFGSSIASHFYGEHITVHNLLRGLLLPSGNDTANIVAAHVSYVVSGEDMDFAEAEQFFANLMNERARSIGAVNSNFTNAHGFHDPLMQVTARDLAKITDYAMNNSIIMSVASEISFIGESAPNPDGNLNTREIDWSNTNRLLVGEFFNEDVTGLKTGFHTPAGWCFIGTAYRDGIELISVIAGSYANVRWVDTNALFDYSFENYEITTIHNPSNVIETINIQNSRWGDESTVNTFGTTSFSHYISIEELSQINRDIVFFENLLYTPEYGNENDEILFLAPLYAGDVVGNVIYSLNGVELFRDNIVVPKDVLPWSILSSIGFVTNYLIENPFSIFGLSFMLAIIFFGIICYQFTNIVINIRRKRLKSKGSKKYKF